MLFSAGFIKSHEASFQQETSFVSARKRMSDNLCLKTAKE